MAIMFDIGFKLDGKSLENSISTPLAKINSEIDASFQKAIANGGQMAPTIQRAVVQANALKTAITEATTDKGLSFSVMQQSLARSGTSAKQLLSDLGSAGPAFTQSFNQALISLSTANRQVLTISKTLQEAGRVFAQSLKFTTAQTAIRFLSSSFSQAIGWVQDLDSAVANIAVVTGKSGVQLNGVYENIIQGAADLRVASKEYAEASLIFYQQGLNDEEVKRRTDITIEAAKAAGQSVETMASQLTAIWNSYQMIGEEQERAAAIGAKLAASTAVDFKDIAEAMQTAAAPAAQMGVSYESLAAIIATVGDATQQSASVIGNAYKTIFSRFEQLTVDGSDGEVTLTSVSQKLQSLGINLFDAAGELRDLDSVIKEVGLSWDSYSQTQQTAIAQVVGGTRQYGQFLSLMENFPQYMSLVETATEETGTTLTQQFIAARETVEAAAENSKEAWNQAMSQLVTPDIQKTFYSAIESAGEATEKLIDTLGGLPGILMLIGQLFQKNIGNAIVSVGISATNLAKSIAETLVPSLNLTEKQIAKDFSQSRGAMNKDNAERVAAGTMSQAFADGQNTKSVQAEKVAIAMSKVNKMINEGDEAARNLGESLKIALEEAEKKFQRGVDSAVELKDALAQVKEEAATLAGQLNEGNFSTEDVLKANYSTEDVIEYQDASNKSKDLGDEIAEREKLIAYTEKELQLQQQINQAKAVKNDSTASAQERIKASQQISQATRELNNLRGQGTKLSEEEYNKQKQIIEELKKQKAEADAIVDKWDKVAESINKSEIEGAALTSVFAKAGESLAEAVTQGTTDGTTVLTNFKGDLEAAFSQLGIAPEIQKQISAGLLIDGEGEVSLETTAQRIKTALAMAEKVGIKIDIDPTTFSSLQASAAQTAQGIKQIGDETDRTKEKLSSMKVSAAQVAQACVGVMTGALQLTNQLNKLFESLGQGTFSFSQLASSALIILPTLMSFVRSLDVLSKGFANSSIAAKIFGMEASAAIAQATLGISLLIAAVIAVVVAFQSFVAGEAKAAEEALQRDAEAAKEAADSTRECTAAIEESKIAYEEALSSLEGLTRGTEAYAAAAQKAADAARQMADALVNSGNEDLMRLGNDLTEAINVAEYTGDWEKLSQEMEEVEKQALAISVATNQKAATSSSKIFSNAIGTSKDIGDGASHADEGKAEEVVNRNNFDHVKMNGNHISVTNDGSLEDQKKAYEEMLEILRQMDEEMTADERGSSELYKNLQEYVDGAADAYNNLTEAESGSYEEQSKLFSLDPKAFFESMDIDPEELGISKISDLISPEGGFQNLDEYDEWVEKIKAVGEAAGWSEEQVNNLIVSDTNTVGNRIAESKITSSQSSAQSDIDRAQAEIDSLNNDSDGQMAALQQELTTLQQQLANTRNHQIAATKQAAIQEVQAQISALQETRAARVAELEEQQQQSEEVAQNIETALREAYENADEDMKKHFDEIVINPELYLDLEGLKKDVEKQMQKFSSIELDAKINEDIVDEEWLEQMKIVEGLSIGDTISKEDFDALGEGYSSFFQLMEDGTYQLIGDAEKLEALIESTHQQLLMSDAASAAEEAQMYAPGEENADVEMYNKLMETSRLAQQQVLATADSLKELDALYYNLSQTMAEVGEGTNYTAYAEALQGLAGQYENTTEEAKDYALALQQGNTEQIKAAESALKAATMIGEAADKYGLSADSLEIQAKELRKVAGEEEMTAEQAAVLAVRNQRMNKGVTELAKNWKTWSKELKKTDKTTQDFADTAADLSDAIADLVNWYDELSLDSEFITENMGLIEKAAEGDVVAIGQLGAAVSQEAVANAQLDQSLVNIVENGAGPLNKTMTEVNTAFEEYWQKMAAGTTMQQAFESAQAGVAAGFQAISDNMETLINNPDALTKILGGEQGLTDFVTQLNAYAAATGMTAEEMQKMLSSVGVTANVTTDYVKQEVETPVYEEHSQRIGWETYEGTDLEGNTQTYKAPVIKRYTVNKAPEKHMGFVGVAKIDMEGADGSSSGVPPIQFTGVQKPSTSAINGGSSGGGGGKSSTPKAAKKSGKRTEKKEKERYTDNENAIEDLTTAIEKLNRANDHAWGPQKIRNINLINSQISKQAKLYQNLRKEAEGYIETDAEALKSGLALVNEKTGLSLTAKFDGDNLLDNEMELRNSFADYLNSQFYIPIRDIEAAIDQLIEDNPGITEEDERIKSKEEDIEKIKANAEEAQAIWDDAVGNSIESYQEAIRKREEALAKEVELVYTWLQGEIDKYTLKMELHLEISDIEYRMHEMIINNMGEIGKMSHQVSEMLRKDLKRVTSDVDETIDHYNKMKDLADRWSAGDQSLKVELGISDEAWNEAMQSGEMPAEIKDALTSDIDQLMDLRQKVWDNLDQQWQNYIDAVQYYIDEYDRITDRLDKQLSISDNLLSIIETVGFNYKWGADDGAAYFKNMSAQMDTIRTKAKNVNGELAFVSERRKEAEAELKALMGGQNAFEFAQNANEAQMFEYNRIKEHYDELADKEAELNATRIELMNEAYQKATEYAEKWGDVLHHEMTESLDAVFDSFDEAMDVYNQKRDIDTFFMDEYDKTFELNKLQREINDAIDDITNPEQLKRYNDLLAEIEAKKEAGVKMTEKDLEILRAQFDLEQARDAYEDARNQKNTMRLQRDASGNYAYVYSSDENSVEDTEAKVEEALHNIYKMHREAADEYAETWLQLQVDWDNFVANIDWARYNQDVKYRDMVNQRMAWYTEQSDLLSNEIIKHNAAIDRSFEDTTLGVIIKSNNMAQANEMYKQNHTDLKDALLDNYNQWIDKADETMREVGGSMEDLESVVNTETDKMMDEVDNLNETIDRLNWESQAALSDMAGFIGGWVSDVNQMYQEVIDQIDRLIQKHKEMMEEFENQAQQNADFDFNKDYAAEYLAAIEAGASQEDLDKILAKREYKMKQGYGPKNAATNEELIGIGSMWKDNRETAQKALDSIQQTSWSKEDKTDIGTLIEEVSKVGTNIEALVNGLGKQKTEKATALGWDGTDGNPDYRYKGQTATGGLIKTPQVRSLAEEGPELVLNADDTQKILNAVKLMRGTVQSQLGLVDAKFFAQAGRVAEITPYIPPTQTDQAVEQTVHIDATFPNVSAAAEVEAAINSLIVQAAHYNVNNK